MSIAALCLDCGNRYSLDDVLTSRCPNCGSARWQSPPTGGIYLLQNKAAPESVTQRRALARNLREYARALQEDDINDFYSDVVAEEMVKAANVLEGREG